MKTGLKTAGGMRFERMTFGSGERRHSLKLRGFTWQCSTLFHLHSAHSSTAALTRPASCYFRAVNHEDSEQPSVTVSNTSRRDFLKLLGVGAAAALVEEPIRKMWFVGSNAPVGSRVERMSGVGPYDVLVAPPGHEPWFYPAPTPEEIAQIAEVRPIVMPPGMKVECLTVGYDEWFYRELTDGPTYVFTVRSPAARLEAILEFDRLGLIDRASALDLLGTRRDG